MFAVGPSISVVASHFLDWRHFVIGGCLSRLLDVLRIYQYTDHVPGVASSIKCDPGLESKGSSLPIPNFASPPLRFLSFGAKTPVGQFCRRNSKTRRVIRLPHHEAFESSAMLLLEQQ